jgi:hypothetical protein
MASPAASHVKKMFVDEPQDCYSGHPDRYMVWLDVALYTSTLELQRVFCSASQPDHLHKVFCQKAGLDINVKVIRGSTDRPELGYHVVTVNPSSSRVPIWESLKRLVFHLKTMLRSDERIIIFFQGEDDADRFAMQTGCSKYHSKLPKEGNSKGYYFKLWARGEEVVMAASTAFQQGVDYPFVAFVLYYKSAYGLIDYTQGAGRGGRRGRFAYVIILRDEHQDPTCPWSELGSVEDTRCKFAFLQLARNVKSCMRYLILNTMDGEKLAKSCKDVGGSNRCGPCDPEAMVAKFIQQAVHLPIPSSALASTFRQQPGPSAHIETNSDDEYGSMEFTSQMAKAMDDVTIPQVFKVDCSPYSRGSSYLIMFHQMQSLSVDTSSSSSSSPYTAEQDAMKVAQLAITKRKPISSHPHPYTSQPVASLRSSQRIQPPPMPASVPRAPPKPRLAVNQRAQRSLNLAGDRLTKSSFLNTCMQRTRDQCGRCFVTSGRLLTHRPFYECPDDGVEIPPDWLTLKTLFTFQPFTYCWNCGTPQDRRGNKESPDCHRGWKFERRAECPWANFIYIAMWSLWHDPLHRANFLREFGLQPNMDYVQFEKWVVDEDIQGGKYYNGLEVYMWYSREWLKYGRR